MYRIISLIASATEIVHALGFGEQMVGRSHECDYPESIKSLPVCTSPKFDTEGTSFEIDLRVSTIFQQSLSVYNVDAKVIDLLQPTHIITQTQCQVCAVSLQDLENATCQLIQSQPKIISLEPNCLKDIYKDIESIGTAFGATANSEKLIEQIKTRMDVVSTSVKNTSKKPRVVFLEWLDPLIIGGNWMPELIELAGGIYVDFVSTRTRKSMVNSSRIEFDELLNSNPDVIIISPCGFTLDRTISEMPIVTSKPHYTQLNAVREGEIFVVDGNQYMNRPGPRIVDSLEILAAILHPDLFKFPQYETSWLRYS